MLICRLRFNPNVFTRALYVLLVLCCAHAAPVQAQTALPASPQTSAAELLTQEERDWLAKNQKRIVLAVETGYGPFVFLDSNGQFAGLAHEHLLLLESKLGIHFQQKPFTSLDDAFAKIRSGEVHLINAVTQTPWRSEFLSFTSPYISIPNVIIVRKERTGQMQEQDLKGLNVSLVKSYAATEHLTEKHPGIASQLVVDDLSALLDVSFGRSDATIIDLATASYLIQQKGITNLRVAGEAESSIALSIGCSKNEAVLCGIIQKGLAAITIAERREIRERWINPAGVSIFLDWRFWLAVGGVLFLVTLVLLWNLTLRKQVALRTADIAKEKEALKESEDLFHSLVQGAPFGIIVSNPEGGVEYLNSAFTGILGYTIEDIPDTSVWWPLAYPDPDYRLEVMAQWQEAVLGQTEHHPVERTFTVQHRDGRSRQIRFIAAPLLSRRILVTLEDITELKHAEENLRASEAKLFTILENVDACIYLKDTDGRYLFANRPVRDLWQVANMAGIVGFDDGKFFDETTVANIRRNDRRVLDDGETLRAEETNTVPATGKTVTYQSTKLPLRLKDGSIYALCGISTDITDRKRAEDEIRGLNAQLEQRVQQRTAELEVANRSLVLAKEVAEAANVAKSDFLANMSHEIRTPMNGILGMASILRRDGVTPKQEERLDKIDTAAQHLLSIINDILDLSKIEAGKFVLEEAPVAVNELLGNVSSILSERAKAKKLRLRIETEFLPDNLIGDATRLQQALLNYAANAIKFTETGSVILRALKQEETAESVLLRLEVEDTGIGIAPEALPRLFSAFEQADNSMTRKYGGTGLGLAIARRLAGLMAGAAGVESTLGVGSTFWFTARLKKGAESVVTKPEENINAESIIRHRHCGSRILAVDDEPFNREVAQMLLESAGLIVDTAKDGEEAVALARQTAYAAILMDMQMPRMNGLDATRKIREMLDCRKTPIIAVTANVFAEDKARCFAAGMNDFLIKPFTPGTLFTTLLRSLNAHDV